MGLGVALAVALGAGGVPGGGQAPFSPKSVGGLTLWLDASQISGIAEGGAVATWPDLSGLGNSASQGTVSDQPAYYATTAGKTVNGKPAVWWENSADFLKTPTFASALTTGALFVVAQITAGNTGIYVLMDTNDSGGAQRWGFGPGFGTSGGTQSSPQSLWQGNYINAATITAIAPQQQWTALYGGAAGSTIRQNGTALVTADAGTNTFQGATIGATYSGGDTLWTGCICELLLYSGIPTATQIGAIEGYLKSKWGTP